MPGIRASPPQALRKPPACDDAPPLARRGGPAVGRGSCILNGMGDNTLRYGHAAPGARLPGANSGERAMGAAATGRAEAGRGTVMSGSADRRPADQRPAERRPAGRRPADRRPVDRPGAFRSDAWGLRGALAGATAAITGALSARASQGPAVTGLAGAGESAGVLAAPAATYWRRRFLVLAVGLAILGAAAWGLSDALRVHPGAGTATGQHGAAPGRFAGAGAAPAGPRHGGRAPASGTRRRGGAGRSQRRKSAGAGTGARTRPTAKPSASGFGGFKPAFCSWHSIVLSLSAAQVAFGRGQEPGFSLSVVSTQPADCSFNVGPGHLALVIKEGPARVWSSADCVSGTGNLVAALRRGVPTVVSIGWNRRTSSPGCAGPVREVPAGTYTGYAADGSIASPPVTFRLN